MGRRSSRALWTAKLTESHGKGGAGGLPVPPKGASSAAKGGRSVISPVARTLAPQGVAAAGTSSLGVGRSATAQSKRLRAEQLAVAKVGTRLPFHGVVLGIDPSLRGTGIAVVRFSPPEQPRLLFSTTVRNKPALSPTQCLGNIARTVSEVIETYRPLCVSLEQTVYVQNVKTSLVLGSARGAAIAPAAMLGLEVFEYAPTRLKQAVVGSGRASKLQVAGMVKSLLQAGRDLLPSDEADAAAAALCHAFTVRL